MARYIDADALLSKLSDDLPYKASVKRVLMQAQEADVVPKSEDDWNSIPVDVSEALKQRAVEKAKADVAREIFKEIEKYVEVALMNGHIETPILCIGHSTFAELKKKYTAGEDLT